MIEEGEIIEIPVENPTYFTNAKQPDIGIIVLKESQYTYGGTRKSK